MDADEALRRRLANLGLTGSGGEPGDVVRRLQAVQSQDYGPGLWSIGQRCGADQAQVEQAVVAGDVVRTHVLRPTWHFVPAEDLPWLLALTAPRVHQLTAYYYRAHGLDEAARARVGDVVRERLTGAGPQPRDVLAAALAAAGLPEKGQGVQLAVMAAELDGVICSGPPVGKQQTYVLLADRIRSPRELDPDAALAELTVRYFASHGPASVADFAWWSSVKRTDVARGLRLAGDRLRRDDVDGVTVYGPPVAEESVVEDSVTEDPVVEEPVVHLLQSFDEIIVGYTETKPWLDRAGLRAARTEGDRWRGHHLLVDGQIAGSWRRVVGRRDVRIELTLDRPLSSAETGALEVEAARVGAFLGLPATLTSP
jgi:hypothetical protein